MLLFEIIELNPNPLLGVVTPVLLLFGPKVTDIGDVRPF